MKLLSGSLKEAQRLYPAAPFNARVLKQDLVLSGYHVPQGVSLRHIVNIICIIPVCSVCVPIIYSILILWYIGCVATYISVNEQQPHTLDFFALLIEYCADAILCNG